jgi:hypothetical protein
MADNLESVLFDMQIVSRPFQADSTFFQAQAKRRPLEAWRFFNI